MAVTEKEFEALTPVPYLAARSQLRTGDIVLFSSNDEFSKLIQTATGSRWSHAGLIWAMSDIDRVLLLESVETFGVRAVALSGRMDGSTGGEKKPYDGKILVVRHSQFPYPVDPKMFGEMTRFAIDRLGSPYAPLEIARIGLRIAAGDLHIPVPGHLEPKNAYICSEYVQKCYAAMGIDLKGDAEGFIAPADIANDPNISAVLTLEADKASVANAA